MKKKSQDGIALLVSILFIGILLSIVFTLSAIFIPKVRSAADIKNSVGAAYAAESALEWCLYESRIGSIPAPVMTDPLITYTVSDCLSSPVHAVGKYRGVTRAFELNY